MKQLPLMHLCRRVFYLAPFIIWRKVDRIAVVRDTSTFLTIFSATTVSILCLISLFVITFVQVHREPIVTIDLFAYWLSTSFLVCHVSLNLWKIETNLQRFIAWMGPVAENLEGTSYCLNLLIVFAACKIFWTLNLLRYLYMYIFVDFLPVLEILYVHVFLSFLVHIFYIIVDMIPLVAYFWKIIIANVLKTRVREVCSNIERIHTGQPQSCVPSSVTKKNFQHQNGVLETIKWVLNCSLRIKEFDKTYRCSLFINFITCSLKMITSIFKIVGFDQKLWIAILECSNSAFCLFLIFEIPEELKEQVAK